jgi:hypothetical protein
MQHTVIQVRNNIMLCRADLHHNNVWLNPLICNGQHLRVAAAEADKVEEHAWVVAEEVQAAAAEEVEAVEDTNK